jgi:transcriptional regulator with XRE-family HTH domain
VWHDHLARRRLGYRENVEPDNRIGQFLRARRELVQPEDVGIESYGRRRVPGLRREELAMLAGVSVDYYVRLEQGRERHPSEQVLEALARALQLDDTAARHLQELARPPARRRRPSARPQRVRPGVERLMNGWAHTPAIVLGRCLDVLAANSLADALHGHQVRGSNVMRSIFLDPGAHDFYADWEDVARDTVATLRALAGADLDDPRLTELVGELSLKSEKFRRLWARHDVREKTSGTKRFVHPIVGELSLGYESFAIGGAPGQILIVYHAEPGSRDEQALALLESVAAGEGAEEVSDFRAG